MRFKEFLYLLDLWRWNVEGISFLNIKSNIFKIDPFSLVSITVIGSEDLNLNLSMSDSLNSDS